MKCILTTLFFSLAIPAVASAVEGPVYPNHLSVGNMRDLERQTVAQILTIQDDSTLVVKDLNDREIRLLKIHDGVRLQAQSRREFDGRRKLSIDDLEPGRILRITLTHPFGEVRRVRVLRHGNVPKTHFQAGTELGRDPKLLLEPFPGKAGG